MLKYLYSKKQKRTCLHDHRNMTQFRSKLDNQWLGYWNRENKGRTVTNMVYQSA